MGADRYYIYYGIRFLELHQEGEEISDDLFEEMDPRQIAARKLGLDSVVDEYGNEEGYALLIGKELGWVTGEEPRVVSITPAQVDKRKKGIAEKLNKAGFKQKPAFHFIWSIDH